MSEHLCTETDCPEGANYFVTMADYGKLWYMAGPYKTHGEALALVDRCREIAYKNDPKSWFYSIGTVRSERVEPGSITKACLL